jgi:hypothetical protein
MGELASTLEEAGIDKEVALTVEHNGHCAPSQ